MYCLEWLRELLREDYRPLPQAVEVGLRRRMTTNTLMKMVIGLVEKRKQEAELLKEGAGRVRGETKAMELNRRRLRMASSQPSGRRRLPLDCILLNPSMASLLSFATAAEFCKI